MRQVFQGREGKGWVGQRHCESGGMNTYILYTHCIYIYTVYIYIHIALPCRKMFFLICFFEGYIFRFQHVSDNGPKQCPVRRFTH